METKLIWITPNAEQMISDMARVSNPDNQGKDGTKLLSYLVRNKHWSPFEMASACFEINTTRDIARQILRHRSFSFQEFSQRYAQIDDEAVLRECRLQDMKNRQNSIETEDKALKYDWEWNQKQLWEHAIGVYLDAIDRGIAKEVARAVLPEGNTPSRMYMSGTIRSWIHYLEVRGPGSGTQKEHMEVANSIALELYQYLPSIKDIVND